MNTYNTTYLNSMTSLGLLTDRVISDTLKLPYSYDDFKIRPNTIVDSRSFNTIIDRINKNFLYLVSYGKIPTTEIPINFSHYIQATGTDFTFSAVNAMETAAVAAGSVTLDGIRDIATVGNIHGDTISIACNSTTVLVLSTRQSGNGIKLLNSSDLTTVGGRKFEDINAVAVDDSDNAYIMDGASIYKYDISAGTQDDSAMKNVGLGARNLTLTMGGPGTTISDTDKFKSPIALSVYNNNIYVIDQPKDYTSGFLKIYDTNFNFKSSHNITSDLKTYPAVDIMPTKTGVFILSLSGHILEYNNDINLVKTHLPNDKVSLATESFKKLESSKENDNVFYVMTNKNVFKKYKSKPSKTINRFQIPGRLKIPAPNFTAISINPTSSGKDELFLSDSGTNSVYRCIEDIGYQDAFYDSFQTQIFELNSLYINKEEYVNNFVFNKAFSKILFNHFVLKENARAKFEGTYDSNNDLLFNGIKYPLDSELAAVEYTTSSNNYVGVNEVLLSETINRPIKEIYKLQLLILEFIKNRATNTAPINSVVVELPSS
jgi:hypothetical protein